MPILLIDQFHEKKNMNYFFSGNLQISNIFGFLCELSVLILGILDILETDVMELKEFYVNIRNAGKGNAFMV